MTFSRDLRGPGSMHDSTAFKLSNLCRDIAQGTEGAQILEDNQCWIAADAAYPNKDFIVTPIPGKNLPEDLDAFNYFLSSNRNNIERAFGMMYKRFRILRGALEGSLKTNILLLNACAILSNLCLDQSDDNRLLEELESTGLIPCADHNEFHFTCNRCRYRHVVQTRADEDARMMAARVAGAASYVRPEREYHNRYRSAATLRGQLIMGAAAVANDVHGSPFERPHWAR